MKKFMTGLLCAGAFILSLTSCGESSNITYTPAESSRREELKNDGIELEDGFIDCIIKLQGKDILMFSFDEKKNIYHVKYKVDGSFIDHTTTVITEFDLPIENIIFVIRPSYIDSDIVGYMHYHKEHEKSKLYLYRSIYDLRWSIRQAI